MNTQIFKILREIHDETFLFKVNFLTKLSKPVELTPKWIKTDFKYQDPYFYYRLFDESENGPFEFPPVHIKTYDKNSVPDPPKLYVLQENKGACVLC